LRNLMESKAGSEDLRLLWVIYVAAYVEANGIPTFSVSNLDAIAQEIDASIETFDLALIPDARALALEVLEARAERRPYVFDPTQRSTSVGGDPVELFNGQFVQEATDLTINGAGSVFSFRRTYRNQAGYSGPIGANWDHAYNVRLKVVGETILLSDGTLRTALYIRHPAFGQSGFNYWVPPDGEHAVLLERASSFALRMPSGTRQFFEASPSIALEHRITRIEDRHGNFLAFQYRDAVDGLLSQVTVNNNARIVTFDYDGAGRIQAITDYTGRIWVYRYDDFGDLVAVTTPATADAPSGCMTRYEYSSESISGELGHNLVRIVDPLGRTCLENEYGTERGLIAFNRVVRQRFGSGVFQYDYANVVEEFDVDYADAERPAHQTTMTDRNGHVTVNIFNRSGNLIMKQERILMQGRLVSADWRYRYNADGALIAQLSHGRLLEKRDAAGTTTVSEPFAASDGVREGYLRRQTIDPGGLALTTTFEVNAVGVVTAVIQPKGHGLTDGRYRTAYVINELDQRIATTVSAPFLFSSRTVFDLNGNPARDERDLRDEAGLPILGGVEVKTSHYDVEQHLHASLRRQRPSRSHGAAARQPDLVRIRRTLAQGWRRSALPARTSLRRCAPPTTRMGRRS
jgi:YD repeat-containing protein